MECSSGSFSSDSSIESSNELSVDVNSNVIDGEDEYRHLVTNSKAVDFGNSTVTSTEVSNIASCASCPVNGTDNGHEFVLQEIQPPTNGSDYEIENDAKFDHKSRKRKNSEMAEKLKRLKVENQELAILADKLQKKKDRLKEYYLQIVRERYK